MTGNALLDVLLVIGFLGAWFIAMRFVLPRLGVPT